MSSPSREAAAMEDEWKALGEAWGHPHPLAHRRLGLDEDLRAGDSISPSLARAPPTSSSLSRRPSQEGEEDDGDDDKVARPTSAVASFIRPYLAADISSAHRFPPPFLPCSYPPLVASMANSSGFFPRFSSQESIKKIENCLPGTAKQVPCELLHRPRRHGPEVSMARRCAAKS